MLKGKLKKYSDLRDMPNVVEASFIGDNPLRISEYWRDTMFAERRPIVCELGCGRGDYTVNLAAQYPNYNFIGIDIKGARLWHGAQSALSKKMENVLFVRLQIDHLALFFPPERIEEIWITFPDPHIRQPQKNAKNRLTSKRFLSLYRKILCHNAPIHLKTDNSILFHFTKEEIIAEGGTILQETEDLYNSPISGAPVEIQTTYEKTYLKEGKSIKYLKFSL